MTKVKVYPPDQGEPTLSFTGKVLKFLVWILIVPVSVQKDEQYNFKVKSWRLFLAILIWIIPSWISVGVLVGEQKSASFIIQGVGYLQYFAKIASPALMIPSMGFLVKTIKITPNDMVQVASGFLMTSYVVFILLDMTFNAYLVSTASSDGLVFRVLEIIVTNFSNIVMTSSLLIVRMYCTAFVAKTKEVQNAKNENDLIEKSVHMLSLYRSMKKGFGPLLFVAFVFGTLYTVSTLYLSTKWIPTEKIADLLNYATKLISKFFQLLIISLACQYCYIALRETKLKLR